MAKNFSKSTLAAPVDSADTTLQLPTGHAARFDVGDHPTIWNKTDFPADPSDDPNHEIVTITSVNETTDELTVLRGAENTTAVAHDTSGKEYGIVAGPTAGLPEFVTLPFDAANFTTSDYEGPGMTWTVPEDNTNVIRYLRWGSAVVATVNLLHPSNNLTGTPEDELRITIPFSVPNEFNGGLTPFSYSHAAIASGAWQTGGVWAQDLSGVGTGPFCLTFTSNPAGSGTWPEGGIRIVAQFIVAAIL